EAKVTDAEANRIRTVITGWTNVQAVQYTTEKQEFDKILALFKDDAEQQGIVESFSGDKNPFAKTITITMVNPELSDALKKQLETTFSKEISDINFNSGVADTILPLFDTIRKGSYALIAAVAFVAIILISNTIRITIVARRTEIGIMRLVAASNWYIRTPFILEGVILGIIGALIATGGVSFAYWYYLPIITQKLFVTSTDMLVSVDVVLEQLLVWTTTLGGVIGFLGSIFPVRKYLKK
ncbi:MAG: permease-like cell division protein FtsX, partial [Culicoidibacterales bacterium]